MLAITLVLNLMATGKILSDSFRCISGKLSTRDTLSADVLLS